MAGCEPEPYQWRLSEYVLRCQQGSDIKEIVVEGELDRDVISDALHRWGYTHVAVLDSDYVHISNEDVADAGFEKGPKGRLLTIAHALATSDQTTDLVRRVAIVVDHDYDGAPSDNAFLLLTDGYSLESYAFTEEALDRFVRLVLGRGRLPSGVEGSVPPRRHTCSGRELMLRLEGASVSIAAVRLVLRSLAPQLRPFESWSDYVAVEADGSMEARPDDLLKNVLTTSGRPAECEAALRHLPAALNNVRKQPQLNVRGHDFVKLVLKLLRSSWGRSTLGARHRIQDEGYLARVLLTAVDPATLDNSALFLELRRRFIPAA